MDGCRVSVMANPPAPLRLLVATAAVVVLGARPAPGLGL